MGLKVIQESGGSGTGYSYWKQVVRCPKKVQLNAEIGRDNEPYFETGTLFHHFLELYYKGHKFDPSEVVFDPAPRWEDSLIEAQRLARAYFEEYPADEWNVVGTEVQLPTPDTKELVESSFGLPWTGRVDMVIDITKEQSVELAVSRQIDVEPGKYIVDHKTDKAKTSNLIDKYKNSLQFYGYMYAWNLIHPTQPVKGLLVNCTVKTKVPQFFTLVVDYPDEVQIQGLLQFYKYAGWMYTNMVGWANPEECFSGYKPCGHFLYGRCARV